jgi:hypothetical protein
MTHFDIEKINSANLSLDASPAYERALGLSSFVVLAVKSVWQYYVPPNDVLRLLEVFRRTGTGWRLSTWARRGTSEVHTFPASHD